MNLQSIDIKPVKDTAKIVPHNLAHLVSPGERIAAGKALRDKIPRKKQGECNEFKGRPNPIEFLRKLDAGRVKKLVPIRYGRMLQSPFAFYRGAASVMASDLARVPNTGLKVQACGDSHLANFGGFATPERNVIFDINDFDETSPAPWEWDVKRLVTSIVLAGRANGLSDNQGRDCAVSCAPGTASTCVTSPKWTRFGFGTQKPAPPTLSNPCQRPYRKTSGSGSKEQQTAAVQKWIIPSSRAR
jgi:hypothetical protein